LTTPSFKRSRPPNSTTFTARDNLTALLGARSGGVLVNRSL